jgi:hypothetical protein
VRIRIALKSVRPRLPLHAYSRTLAARIAEALVESQGTRLRIEIRNEQAVIAIFA